MEEKNKDINAAEELSLKFMEAPESLTDAELQQLLNDEESARLCQELMDCKQASIREFSRKGPNVEQEWKKFSQRSSGRSGIRIFTIGGLAGIAASLLFFVLFYKNFDQNNRNGLMVFKANELPQQVTLQTSSGDNYVLNNRSTDTSLIKNGIANQSSPKSLAYNPGRNSSGSEETHTLTTPRGTDFKVTLADGTTVWLNAESKLEYPAAFSGKERVVRLTGEAYFEVAKDKTHPFIVQTGNLRTKVLGTQFNVRNYSQTDSHVTLIEGSVEVSNAHGTGTTRIKPGEDAQLKTNGDFSVKEVDVDSYIYWKDGFFYFDNVSLADIMQNLGRWYNINIIFHNKEAMDYKMHYLCDRKGGIEHAITLLNRMKKVDIKLDGNTLYIR